MSNDEFQSRINRLNSKPRPQHIPRARVQPKDSGGFSWAGAVKGFILSLVIGFAFTNLQAIRDMAPQSIKDGPTPGIFGLPVVIITVLWLIITPIWFLRAFMKGVMSSWSVAPAGFPIGLFARFALVFLTLRGGLF